VTHESIAAGLDRLDDLFVEAIRTFAPPNPQFERDRIVRDLTNKREVAYVCGFLSEGENEAVLIFGLIRDMLAADPDAVVDHLLDEARYYLRTSVDPAWQLEPDRPAPDAAFDYLALVLARRIGRVRARPADAPSANVAEPDARRLLTGEIAARVVND
jgi:hypothetical protein